MGLACRLSALGLLLSALLVCTQSQDQESVFAIVGEDFTFSPKVKGTIREITWMKRKNKVAEWERDGLPTYYSSLAERGKLETSSGNFTIKKLNAGDAAEYEAQVLPDGDVQLQYTKFILEVLAPPSPSVLNCSVTNGQIRISCAIQFSKDVRYSWYRDDRKIDANSPVLELKENADPSGKVLCVREVSKTKINDSISLSACFPESVESISRGRDGLIAIFVILLLLLFVGALFILWKRGLLSRILRRIPTKNSGYTSADPEYENSRDFEVEAHQSGKAAKLMQVEVQVSLQDSNESQAEKDEEKSPKETESRNQPDPPSNEENPDEGKSPKETESVNQSDRPFNEENPDYENISIRNQKPDEGKSPKETESVNQPDPPSNEENPDKSSKETKSMNQPDPPSNQEKTGEAAKLMQVEEDVRVSPQDSNESQAEKDEEKSPKETESMNQPDPPSSEENPEEQKNSRLNQ